MCARPCLQVTFFLARVRYYRPQGKLIFSQMSASHSVHNRPHGYLVTAHPCYGAVCTHATGMLSCSTYYGLV